ncbi:MAG: hypothetical protein E6G56_03250 [Actinobacteria bacterium]|nr:MAG: hypothetical protein E6G56_03250 [Actinomycetota bacterium]
MSAQPLSGARASGEAPAVRPSRWTSQRVLGLGLVALAAYHLALGLFMVVAPHTFYVRVGAFGPENHHYIGDNATYALAVGLAFVGAVRWSSWRVPVLALTTVQFALHTANHLRDISRAHPRYEGPLDFALLLAGTALLAGLLWAAVGQERERRALGPGRSGA